MSMGKRSAWKIDLRWTSLCFNHKVEITISFLFSLYDGVNLHLSFYEVDIERDQE